MQLPAVVESKSVWCVRKCGIVWGFAANHPPHARSPPSPRHPPCPRCSNIWQHTRCYHIADDQPVPEHQFTCDTCRARGVTSQPA